MPKVTQLVSGGGGTQSAKLKVSGVEPVCLLMDPFKLL